MPKSLPAPLGGAPPAEVPLTRSPLERVVMQVRFSTVLMIESKDAIAGFQEEVRSDYPLFEQVTSQQLQINLGAPSPALRPVVSNVWKFSDAARNVRLSLGSEAATLEALQYEGRSGLLARWTDILARVERVFAPTLTLRTGVRYLNRISGDGLTRLTDLIEPSLIGVAQPHLRKHVTQALSEAALEVEEGQLALRWGVLAPNTTIDPGLLTPIPEPSWILDIDIYSGQQKPFSGTNLTSEFRSLAERSYALFRYATTEQALTFFGAKR